MLSPDSTTLSHAKPAHVHCYHVQEPRRATELPGRPPLPYVTGFGMHRSLIPAVGPIRTGTGTH